MSGWSRLSAVTANRNLVLLRVPERIVMADSTLDYERLDVYQLPNEFTAFSYQLAKSLPRDCRHDEIGLFIAVAPMRE
jgi:hypothetical protein